MYLSVQDCIMGGALHNDAGILIVNMEEISV